MCVLVWVRVCEVGGTLESQKESTVRKRMVSRKREHPERGLYWKTESELFENESDV